MRRPLAIAFTTGVAALVGSQVLCWHHARAMTTFVAAGARTPPPEELDAAGRLRTLLLGVRIPRPEASRAPEDLGLPRQDLPWTGPEDTPQVAWHIPAGGGEAAGTVILWHGYAAARDQLLETAARLHAAGQACVLADLPGSGDGPGNTTTLGLREAESVARLARAVREATGEDPVLYGFSMGGSAVLHALARADELALPVRGAVVEATFARLLTTVQRRFHLMGLPGSPGAELLLFWGGWQAGFDADAIAPVAWAEEVTVPVLVLQGGADPRATPEDGAAIAAALGAHGELALLEGLAHAQAAAEDPSGWDRAVLPWLGRLQPSDGP